MPYVISYPKAFTLYRTRREADAAAYALCEARDGAAKAVEIYHVKFVGAFDFPDDDPENGNGGLPTAKVA